MSGRLLLLVLIPLAGVLAPDPGEAQAITPPLERSWMTLWSDGPPASGVTPALWLDGNRVGYGVAGAISLGLLPYGTGPGDRDASAPLVSGPPPGGLVEFALLGLSPDARSEPLAGAASARLHLAGDRYGAWVATGGLVPGDGSAPLPLLGGGVWLRQGGMTFTTRLVQMLRPIRVAGEAPSAEENPDESPLVRRLFPQDDVRLLTGVEAGLGWAGERIEVRTRAGIARGRDPSLARWGEVRAVFQAASSVALFASLQTTARLEDALDSVQGSRTAIGVQLTPGRRMPRPAERPRRGTDGFAIERAGQQVRLLLAAEGESIEVACDATGWRPVPAWRTGPDLWEVVLPLSPGLHRIAMRVDGGAWRPPPGMPAARDDFGGEVGLLIVD